MKEILTLLQTKEYIVKTELKKYSTKSRVLYALTEEGKDILNSLQFLRDSLQING